MFLSGKNEALVPINFLMAGLLWFRSITIKMEGGFSLNYVSKLQLPAERQKPGVSQHLELRPHDVVFDLPLPFDQFNRL